ncbi:hypothetical protein [Proteus sp. NMG38-2]|uniref:hypothetical protein n=1 Tax=Proteus sp. NMG38-2 TaxID=2883107 RepID=UPI001D0B6F63|nr:hypothetical protein [Proteus sp. NMG38-2]UDN36884.1 hypothetical protein LG402_04235 [Proteus sp. NMG38-2]
MNRANKAIKYVEKIVSETIRDVIGINNLINEDFYEIISELDSNNKDRYIDYISTINFNSSGIALIYIIQTYRRKNEISYSLERFLYHKNLCFVSDYFDQFERDKNFFDLAEQGEILLMNFACNYFKPSEICYDKIIENIQSGKMANSLPMYTRPQKLGVLAIEMLASEKKETIDWESADIPIDPFYQRFCQEALYCENDEILIPWLMELCDKHIQWSALFSDYVNEKSATGYEIDMEILIAWPFEYQAVKNFRARHGLSTPIIEHPLLKTPMAIDHRPDMVGWLETMPEIYHQITDDLIKINPELKVIHTLF